MKFAKWLAVWEHRHGAEVFEVLVIGDYGMPTDEEVVAGYSDKYDFELDREDEWMSYFPTPIDTLIIRRGEAQNQQGLQNGSDSATPNTQQGESHEG